MVNSRKRNAPGRRASLSQLAGVGSGQIKVVKCETQHITKLRRELHKAGLALKDTSGGTQRETLLRVLQYLGPRGINTPQGVGCGYYRIATRIQELEERGWEIASLRETIIGADGYKHTGIARYCLIGRLADKGSPQGSLDLGDAT